MNISLHVNAKFKDKIYRCPFERNKGKSRDRIVKLKVTIFINTKDEVILVYLSIFS